MSAATAGNFSTMHCSVLLHLTVAAVAEDTSLHPLDPGAEAAGPGIMITGGIEAEEGVGT